MSIRYPLECVKLVEYLSLQLRSEIKVSGIHVTAISLEICTQVLRLVHPLKEMQEKTGPTSAGFKHMVTG